MWILRKIWIKNRILGFVWFYFKLCYSLLLCSERDVIPATTLAFRMGCGSGNSCGGGTSCRHSIWPWLGRNVHAGILDCTDFRRSISASKQTLNQLILVFLFLIGSWILILCFSLQSRQFPTSNGSLEFLLCGIYLNQGSSLHIFFLSWSSLLFYFLIM